MVAVTLLLIVAMVLLFLILMLFDGASGADVVIIVGVGVASVNGAPCDSIRFHISYLFADMWLLNSVLLVNRRSLWQTCVCYLFDLSF